MTKLTTLKKRLDQFQPLVDGIPAFIVINLRGDAPVSIPDEFNPKKDILFMTTYLDREGNEPGASSKINWRGKPWS